MSTAVTFRWVCLACLVACPYSHAVSTTWPSTRDGLLFAFPTAFESAYALDSKGDLLPGWKFTPRGSGRIDHNGALQFFPGGFQADGLSSYWGKSLAAAREMTLSFRFSGEHASQGGPILTFGGTTPLVRVNQHWKTMQVFAGSDVEPAVEFPFDGTCASITATLADGVLIVYLDGAEQARAAVEIPENAWEAPEMLIGHARQPLLGNWHGSVEHIALYDRALDASVIAPDTAALEDCIAARKPVERLMIRARLVGKSTVPTAESIAPYSEGLCVFRYEVLEVIRGACEAPWVQVAHWMVLDKKQLYFHRYPEGREFTLVLERFDDNPQLETEYISDDIVTDFSQPYYFDAPGLSCYTAPGTSEN